jgi:SAM-dependent methyltransferase
MTGALQIIRFNRHQYIRGALAVAIAFVFLPKPLAAIGLFWMLASVAVSHYVYDRSPLYTLSWVPDLLSTVPQRWANIHAGLDVTTGTLRTIFPAQYGVSLDIYDPEEMTEPSIAIARNAHPSESALANWRSLPFDDGSLEAVFLFLAAHELRNAKARATFFAEIARSLRPGADLIVVEHLRNIPNFLAFGPGFLHFFSARTWRNAASGAGLQLARERNITPFVRAFAFRRIP